MVELRPSGFPEYSPNQQLIFDKIKNCIEKCYQRFGYTHIQTPAVEKNEVLLSKNGEETGKQIFGLYGMAQGSDDLKDYGLHFDLTVPFARYTLDWEAQLTFPFKRYQIQPVWRGERAQKGRYREFFQCDIDVIWKGEKNYLYYDAEIIATLGNTLSEILQICELNDHPIFHISNKKIINAFLNNIANNENEAKAISNLIDKFNKIGKEVFIKTLKEDYCIDEKRIELILKFISFKTNTIEDIKEIQNFCNSNEYIEGINELNEVITILEKIKSNMNLSFDRMIDLQIIRGLDYYTGTIFETILKNDSNLGSICGGGRYENLTGYIDNKRNEYCGVGGSIGISRLLSKVFEKKQTNQQTIADYLFLNFEETFDDILKLSKEFLSNNKSFEIYPYAEKLGKQFGYADKKGIPFVVILGGGEKKDGQYKIKNMQTGEEKIIPL